MRLCPRILEVGIGGLVFRAWYPIVIMETGAAHGAKQ